MVIHLLLLYPTLPFPIKTFFKNFMYLFMRDTERGRDTGRGRSRPHAGSPTWDSIPGPRGHALSQRQMLNRGAPQAARQVLITGTCYQHLFLPLSSWAQVFFLVN